MDFLLIELFDSIKNGVGIVVLECVANIVVLECIANIVVYKKNIIPSKLFGFGIIKLF